MPNDPLRLDPKALEEARQASLRTHVLSELITAYLSALPSRSASS